MNRRVFARLFAGTPVGMLCVSNAQAIMEPEPERVLGESVKMGDSTVTACWDNCGSYFIEGWAARQSDDYIRGFMESSFHSVLDAPGEDCEGDPVTPADLAMDLSIGPLRKWVTPKAVGVLNAETGINLPNRFVGGDWSQYIKVRSREGYVPYLIPWLEGDPEEHCIYGRWVLIN